MSKTKQSPAKKPARKPQRQAKKALPGAGDILVYFRIPEQYLQPLNTLSEESDRPRSTYIRRLVMESVDQAPTA